MEQHFHREMNEIRSRIAELGGLVESCIGQALTSVKTHNEELVERVNREEALVDELEVSIEEHCLKVLALYQPVAKDLRMLVTILKLINEYESMADLARKIASLGSEIPKSLFFDSQMNLSDLGDMVLKMTNLSLDAFLQEDPELAKQIQDMEIDVDRIHKENRQKISTLIEAQELEFTEAELVLLAISRSLERIGDLACNIAEDVIYLVEAKIIRHHGENE